MKSFVHMAKTPDEVEEKKERMTTEPVVNTYPYGLCISLCDDELDKLGDISCEVGSIVSFDAMAKVTAYSQHEVEEDGKKTLRRRVELQITHLGVEQDEDEQPPSMSNEDRMKSRYTTDSDKY